MRSATVPETMYEKQAGLDMFKASQLAQDMGMDTGIMPPQPGDMVPVKPNYLGSGGGDDITQLIIKEDSGASLTPEEQHKLQQWSVQREDAGKGGE